MTLRHGIWSVGIHRPGCGSTFHTALELGMGLHIFPVVQPDADLPSSATAMQALLDGYGLEEASYANLIRPMVTRARAEDKFIVEGGSEE